MKFPHRPAMGEVLQLDCPLLLQIYILLGAKVKDRRKSVSIWQSLCPRAYTGTLLSDSD